MAAEKVKFDFNLTHMLSFLSPQFILSALDYKSDSVLLLLDCNVWNY